jgi:hypothetical protein
MSEIAAEVRRFYRIVMTNPPTVEDFKSLPVTTRSGASPKRSCGGS